MDKQGFRDICAAMAMQGLVSRNNTLVNAGQTAVVAFDVADAMVAEREKRDRDARRDNYGRVVG